MSDRKDLTTGSVGKKITMFALPIVAMNLLLVFHHGQVEKAPHPVLLIRKKGSEVFCKLRFLFYFISRRRWGAAQKDCRHP